jgi:hypothetical protein
MISGPMKNIELDEITHKRLTSLLSDLVRDNRKALDYDEVINYLIDCYQETTWGHLGAESAGG